jgi:uncharacterized protein YlxP (DUF503 family)
MVIGLLLLEVHLPHASSLKDKRAVMTGFKERIRHRFNVSLAEVSHHDKWQLATLAIITVNNEQNIVDQTLEKIIKEAETRLDGQIIRSEILHL